MITLSLDPHPGSHTVVAMDPNGASLGRYHCSQYAGRSFPICISLPVPFAIRRWSDRRSGQSFYNCFCGQAKLLEQSERVYSIPPSLTSQYRSRRGRKKNDRVDAENVGRALLASPQLTPVHSTEQQRQLQELTHARNDAYRNN